MDKKFAIALALFVSFFTVFHVFVAYSEGVRVASDYLKDNSEVVKEIGAVTKLSLLPLGYQLKDYGTTGYATYNIKVTGTEKSAEGVVSSVKENSKWRVIRAHLLLEDNKVIILKE